MLDLFTSVIIDCVVAQIEQQDSLNAGLYTWLEKHRGVCPTFNMKGNTGSVKTEKGMKKSKNRTRSLV